jgi:D-alanine-D-alanine ligase
MFNRIIFVSDLVENHQNASIESLNLEFTEIEYFQDVHEVLSNIAIEVIHYESPKQLIENIQTHKDDIVISIWSGTSSRNRRALVPSICEAYNIKYVGADTYTSIVCQDKSLSHQYCRKYGVNVPDHIIIEKESDLVQIKYLDLPLVIKPNFEGGSIGISQSNLVSNYDEAIILARKLLLYFKDNIIAEKFIRGNEVSFILFGNRTKIKIAECIKLDLETNEIDIKDTLYGLEIKKRGIYNEINSCITASIDKQLMQKLKKLFFGFYKADIIRIDGRIDENNNFYCIELSPDVYLGKLSSIFKAFEYNGYSYKEMFVNLLDNSLNVD